MSIESHADVRLYFRERIQEVLEARQVDTHETTEYYLVNLLSTFAGESDPARLKQPLVDLLSQAVDASTESDRCRRYRELGDCALYSLGFFSDHVEAKRVSREYVVSMGARGYNAAHQLAHRYDPAHTEVYEELCAKFDLLARVLHDVRESTALRTPQDIVRLYERWRETGSPELAKRLEREGVFPQHMVGPFTLH